MKRVLYHLGTAVNWTLCTLAGFAIGYGILFIIDLLNWAFTRGPL